MIFIRPEAECFGHGRWTMDGVAVCIGGLCDEIRRQDRRRMVQAGAFI